MDVNTRFGNQDVDPDSVIHFPDGLPGFENLKEFKLFHEEGRSKVFWLQSLEDEHVMFSVMEPEHAFVRYQLTLSDEECAALQLADAADLILLVVLYQKDDTNDPASEVRANLLAPLVINTATRMGLQKQLNDVERYVTISAS